MQDKTRFRCQHTPGKTERDLQSQPLKPFSKAPSCSSCPSIASRPTPRCPVVERVARRFWGIGVPLQVVVLGLRLVHPLKKQICYAATRVEIVLHDTQRQSARLGLGGNPPVS
eukprot:2035992-Rhodomonas_salina.1